jgi:hypothetical protein
MPREKHPWELFTPEQFAAMCRIARDKIEAERRKFREEQEALKHRPYSRQNNSGQLGSSCGAAF